MSRGRDKCVEYSELHSSGSVLWQHQQEYFKINQARKVAWGKQANDTAKR